MLRIKYMMVIAALFLLQSPLSFATEGDHHSMSMPSVASMSTSPEGGDEVIRLAASSVQGESDQLARSNIAGSPEQVQAKSNATPVTSTEYPALALLAMAIISMAALSRRDSLRIDR